MKTTILIIFAALLTGCTTVNIQTSAVVGPNKTSAKVNGSAWAEVQASSEATTDTAKSSAGRIHGTTENLGMAAIGAVGGLIAGGM